MNVMEIIGANMDAKILLVAIDVAAHRVMFNTTNGTSVLMKMSVPHKTHVVLLHVTTHLAASNVLVHLDLLLTSFQLPVRM